MPRLLFALFLVAAGTHASEFGRQGQVMPSGSVSASWFSQGYVSEFHLYLQPEVGYFIADHVAAGGGIHYEIINHSQAGADQPTRTIAGFYAFGAFDISMDRWLSLFPRAEAYLLQSGTAGSPTYLGGDLFVPLLFHPAAHFFLGFGPEVYLDLFTSDATTPKRKGLLFRSTIGGYF
jgi:hypothetical protein